MYWAINLENILANRENLEIFSKPRKFLANRKNTVKCWSQPKEHINLENHEDSSLLVVEVLKWKIFIDLMRTDLTEFLL